MEKCKTIFAAACGALGVLFGRAGVMGPLALVLLAGNVLDWFTGQAASIVEGTGLSSGRGKRGIRKKVGYWAEVAVCLCVDALLVCVLPLLTPNGAVPVPSAPVVAPVATLWLCLNEALSVIENLGRMGVPVPPWLGRFITALRAAADAQAPQAPAAGRADAAGPEAAQTASGGPAGTA